MPVSRQIEAYLLPALAEPEDLAGKAVVVIDILRATTTIVHALAAGATQVIPCLEVDDARRLAGEGAADQLLGGERSGGKIPGFDLGNSPLEYTRSAVEGRTLVFTTTNGTRAMIRCKLARRVLIGAFVNLSAICRELAAEPAVALVCAGTDGQVTREDVLFAGAVVEALCHEVDSASWNLNDQAQLAADAWRACVRDLTTCPLGETLRDTRGGRNLIGIGHERDIEIAAQIDKFDFVPELDLALWRITK
jgi:2-phosphosulfolactate phosphatase